MSRPTNNPVPDLLVGLGIISHENEPTDANHTSPPTPSSDQPRNPFDTRHYSDLTLAYYGDDTILIGPPRFRPNILIVHIMNTHQNWRSFNTLFNTLHLVANVRFTSTAPDAHHHLLHEPPHLVILSDPAVPSGLAPASLAAALRDYVDHGGTLVCMAQFTETPSASMAAFFAAYGMAWAPLPERFGDTELNQLHRTSFGRHMGSRARVTAVPLTNVPASQALVFVSSSALRNPALEELAAARLDPERITAAASTYARVGSGYLVYLGDVAYFYATFRAVLAVAGVEPEPQATTSSS